MLWPDQVGEARDVEIGPETRPESRDDERDLLAAQVTGQVEERLDSRRVDSVDRYRVLGLRYSQRGASNVGSSTLAVKGTSRRECLAAYAALRGFDFPNLEDAGTHPLHTPARRIPGRRPSWEGAVIEAGHQIETEQP